MSQQICKIGCWMFCSQGLVGGQHQTVWCKVKELTKCSLINIFVYQNWRVTHLKQLGCKCIDLPQINLMNFKVEYVRPRSGRASDKVVRGQLVSLDGFSFAFRARNEEWRDLQLVSQITFGSPWLNSGKKRFQPNQPNNRTCVFLLCRSKEQICLLCTKVITKKDFKRKLTKACLNLELVAGKETSTGEGSLLTNILCWNCADKNETVVRKILASSKVKLFPAPVGAETNISSRQICFHCFDIPCAWPLKLL